MPCSSANAHLERVALAFLLLDFGPQALIGGSHLPRDITSHLGWQMIQRAYLVVAVPLQSTSTTHLAMLICIHTDKIQGIAIRQLRGAQCQELCVRGMEFELGGDDLFHEKSIARFTHFVKLYV